MFKNLILASALAVGGTFMMADTAEARHRHRSNCAPHGHHVGRVSYAVPYTSVYRSYSVPYVSSYRSGYGYPGYYNAYRPSLQIGIGSPYGYRYGSGYRAFSPGYGYGGYGGYGRAGFGYGGRGYGGFGGSGFSLYLGR